MTKFSNPFNEAPFLQKARARVLEHLDDETFGVAELAKVCVDVDRIW